MSAARDGMHREPRGAASSDGVARMRDPAARPPRADGAVARVVPHAVPTGLARPRLLFAVAVIAALVALTLAWHFTSLARLADPAVVAASRERWRALPLAPLWVIVVFVGGGLVAAPATLMIGATMLIFGPLLGAGYAWLAMMASASVVFVLARRAARGPIDRWLARRGASWVAAFHRRVARHGFVAVLLMRLTPLPFTPQNVLAGASRVAYADFAGGTAVGVVPSIALVAGVATQFDAWIADPRASRLALFVGAVVVALAAGWTLRRWAVRDTRDR